MAGARVSEFFYKESKSIFFLGGGGARVSEFYLLRIQISKIKKKQQFWVWGVGGGEGSWSK